MPPKYNEKECLVFLANVGATTHGAQYNGSSFLDKAKLVMQCLIEKKLFLRPNDELGVVVMGTNETQNGLEFDNIVEMNSLQVPNWDLVEEVMSLQGTSKTSNWIEALYVTLDYLNRECTEVSTTRILVLLNDFKEDPEIVEQFNIDDIVKAITMQRVQLLAIGENSIDEDSQHIPTPSERILSEVCRKVGGKIMTIDSTIPKVKIYKKQPTRPRPWKVDGLDLSDVKIPIAAYLKVRDDASLGKWLLATEADEGSMAAVGTTRVLVDKNKMQHNPDEVVMGHMFGRKFVPFTDEDRLAMRYQSGKKSFMIVGFTSKDAIKPEYLTGNSTYVVVPGEQWAAAPFYSLVKAMADGNKVAIVRKVYNNNNAPKMGILVPRINIPGEPWCLIHVELTFAEDRRVLQGKPVNSTIKALSKEQTRAVDNLIDSMMLGGDETEESFEPGSVNNPSIQHAWNVLSHRALNPNAPLPPIRDDLLRLLEAPNSIKQKRLPHLKKIQGLFPIEKVEPKQKWKKEQPHYSQTTPGKKSPRGSNGNFTLASQNYTSCNKPEEPQESMDIDLDQLADDF